MGPKKIKSTSHTQVPANVLGSRQIASNLAAPGNAAGVFSLDQIGASSTAIAQAASQAIAATQLVPGRRSSSLKASYEAIHLGVASSEFSPSPAYNKQKNKMKINKASASGGSGSLNLSL